MKKTGLISRLMSAVLVCALLFGALSVPASAKSFSDISSSHPSLDAINYVSDNGIIAGTSSTNFSPNVAVTRAMAVTVLYRKAGSPAVSGTNKFTDVSSSAYYYKPVLWATNKGIVSGTSSTTFSPNQNITRQDAAVMLYNLGKNMNHDVSKTTSITGISDYSSVGAYARTAMAWGYATDVIPLLSGKLSPKSTVTRAQLAEFVTTYGVNVEKIIHGKDNLGFSNYSTNEPRYITTSHLNKLYTLVRSAYGSNNGESAVNSLRDRLKKNCTGLCYGMSVAMMLDKLGKIAFNENYSRAKTMYGIKSSDVRKSTIESALNYYHVTTSLPGENHYNVSVPISNQVTTAANVMMSSNRPSLFEHYYKKIVNGEEKTVGHEIIVNSCKKSGTSYILDIIDPNGPTHTQKTLTADGKFGTTPLVSVYARNDYSFYDKIDIDTYKNADSSANTGATVTSYDETDDVQIDAIQYPGEFSTLEIELTGNFSIRNAEGESLQWNGTYLNGNMKTYAVRLSPQGEDSAAVMYVDVPLSDSFHFESLTEGMDVWFSVADQYRYSRISGTDLTSFVVNEEGKMEVDCEESSLEISYAAPGIDMPLLSLSGTGNGHVIMEYGNNALKATGAISDYKIQAVDFSGNLMYNQVIAVSDIEKNINDSQLESTSNDVFSQTSSDDAIS